MATSTEQINDLIAGNTALKDYFEGWRNYYEDRFNTFEADVHAATSTTVYVDQANGSDNNDGSQASPFATLTKALTKMSWGGYITIRLVGDYHLDRQVFVRAGSMRLESADIGNKSKVTFAAIDAGGTGRVPNIYCVGKCHLSLFALDFELGSADPAVSEKGIIWPSAMIGISTVQCSFSVLPGADQAFVHHDGGKSLQVTSTTYPAEMAGLWIDGVAAATDPQTRRDIMSCNMASL